jgi:FixJ family two-component response regulator
MIALHTAVVERRVPVPVRQPTVFVVDDDASVRESLERLIRRAGWKAETFSSAQAFLSRPRGEGPSCLVLDVGLPIRSSLELQRQLADGGQDVPIIFTTGCVDIRTTVQAMKAGAVDFLCKPFDDEDLLSAMRQAIERSEAARHHDAEVQTLRRRFGTLTPREQQVMGLVVSGLLNKQIGGELGTSEITVKAQRGQVMRKMMADSLPDLVRMAARLELPLAVRH